MARRKKSSDMNSVMKGNMGEYYVLAELSRRSWTVAQTARNERNYDILARKNSRQIAVRVKTKTSDAQVFQWNAKKDGEIFGEIGAQDFSVLVDIPENHAESPKFYIIPTPRLDIWLKADFETWLRTPGVRKVKHSPDNKRRLLHMDLNKTEVGHGYLDKLKPYLANWMTLEKH